MSPININHGQLSFVVKAFSVAKHHLSQSDLKMKAMSLSAYILGIYIGVVFKDSIREKLHLPPSK